MDLTREAQLFDRVLTVLTLSVVGGLALFCLIALAGAGGWDVPLVDTPGLDGGGPPGD